MSEGTSADKSDRDICDCEDLATAIIRFDNVAPLATEMSFSLNTSNNLTYKVQLDYAKKIRREVDRLNFPIIAKNAREISDYAASKGIRTCSENHSFVGQDNDRLEALLNAVDHENYGLLVDMGNFVCAD